MFFFLNALHNNKYLTVLYLIGLIKGSHNSYKPDMKEIIDQIGIQITPPQILLYV